MKKFIYSLIIVFTMFLSVSIISAKDVNLYLFHSSTCPHCKEERTYLKELKKKYDYLNVKEYEVHDSISVTEQVRDGLGIKESYVPITIIGSDYIIGFSSATKDDIESLIKEYNDSDYCDVVNAIIKGKDVKKCMDKNKTIASHSTVKNIPLIGKVDVKKHHFLLSQL